MYLLLHLTLIILFSFGPLSLFYSPIQNWLPLVVHFCKHTISHIAAVDSILVLLASAEGSAHWSR